MSQTAELQPDDDNSTDMQQFLTFMLCDEVYGVGILHLKEIIEYGNLTPVPLMPDFIAGVINLRGSVVPVVDLARRFQLPSIAITKRTSIIIIEVSDGEEVLEIGMIVDQVNEVLELEPSQIIPAPSFGAKIRNDFIKNMAKNENDNFMILLDVDKVLSVSELSLLQETGKTLSEK